MPLNAQQSVDIIVGVRLLSAAIELADQPSDLVALEESLAFGSLAALAVADLIPPCAVSGDGVDKAPGQVVDPYFISQAIRGVVGKAVRDIVLVNQRRQANGLSYSYRTR